MVTVPTHKPPTHPGEMLRDEFLEPLGMSQTELAERMGVPFQRVNSLVNGRRGVTADTALRLAAVFGTSPGFWMNHQLRWDLYHAKQAAGSELNGIRPVSRRKLDMSRAEGK
jgi:antitoxin HigA-1